MKIKLIQLLNMKKVIEKLLPQDVPVLVGYDLMKIARMFESEIEMYNKVRIKIYKKYGKEGKDKKITIVPDKIETANKDLQNLLNKEVDIKVKKIKLSSLGDVKLSTVDLLKIELLMER